MHALEKRLNIGRTKSWSHYSESIGLAALASASDFCPCNVGTTDDFVGEKSEVRSTWIALVIPYSESCTDGQIRLSVPMPPLLLARSRIGIGPF